jgi:hypothetical protein
MFFEAFQVAPSGFRANFNDLPKTEALIYPAGNSKILT